MISGYINSSTLFTVYTYGQMMVESGTGPTPPTPTSFYITWTPTTVSGSFSIAGSYYWFSDYPSGTFTDPSFDGVITASAFKSTSITTLNTNVTSVGSWGFYICPSLTSASLSCCTYLSKYAFAACSSLSSVYLPVCETLGDHTFQNCVSLSYIYIPQCQEVGSSAFQRCTSLNSISLPNCSIVYTTAFSSCNSLSLVYLPICESIESNAFKFCSSLNGIDLPSCKSIGNSAFQMDYPVYFSVVSLPECTYIGSSAFFGCSLTELNLPKCSYVGSYAFNGNSISLIDLGDCTYIGSGAFIEGGYLRKTIIRTSSVCQLDTVVSSVFGDYVTNTSFYVPLSLVSSYKSAQYWSNVSNRIFPIWDGGPYYINWTPNNALGTFSIAGTTYNLRDFGGSFSSTTSEITSSAFQSISTITSVSTNATAIRDFAFEGCSMLTTVSLSQVTKIYSDAFSGCTRLTSVSLPVCSEIDLDGFAYCSSMSQAYLPSCRMIGDTAFAYCTSLQSVNATACSQIGLMAFVSCTNLSEVNFFGCEYIDYGAFQNCVALPSLDLNVCSFIDDFAFGNCSSLSILIIRASSVCQLGGTAVFYNTRIASGIGSVYVPASLLETYKSATYWSSISSRIFPISGVTYYIDYAPSTLTGTFSIGGVTYNFSDYNGHFTNFDGVITANAFMMNHSITAISTNATYIGDGAFDGCNNLVTADLAACSFLSEEAFYGCTFLDTLILRSTSMVRVGGPYVLSGTPIVDGNGFVYVPSSLMSEYQNSSDWRSVSNFILPINN